MNNSNIQVSVIIINYNTFTLTCNCIASVLEKTIGVEYEIILVDNASVECDAQQFKNKFPAIQLVKSETNLGFAGGNNLGIQSAKGEFILLLNSDTVLIDNSIGFIFKKCSSIKNLGAATISLVYPDGRYQHAANKFPSVVAHFLRTSRLWKAFKKYYQHKMGGYNYTQSFACDWIWGTFFYFPAANLKLTNGKLPETYFMYSEDVEWCAVFKKNKLQNYYFSESKIVHLNGGSNKGGLKNKNIKKNHLHFIRNNYGFIQYCAESILLAIDETEDKIRNRTNKVIKTLL